ncbi:hypothetical protein ACSBR2_004627 [Camellia fascicularis]
MRIEGCEISEHIEDATVYLDAGCTESFEFLGAYPLLLELGAHAVCSLENMSSLDMVYVLKNEAGMWQWLFGKSMTSIILLNIGSSDGFAGITAPLARILPIRIMPNFGII